MTETYASTPLRNTPPGETFGLRGHRGKCLRISVAVSFAPQYQPQSMRGPGGRPPRFGLGGSFHFGPRTAGRRGQSVKCRRIWLVVRLAPQPQPHGIRGPGDRPMRLNASGSAFQIL